MLKLDSHLMPFPTPDSADRVEATMTITRLTIMEILDGLPSIFISHPMPVILYTSH